ncbi:MAG: amine oxidase [Dictyoglomus sp. NZ13-RE01]|nr:MAG: amine oxidase [Dictyoglomus sp. NZ13-RE01]
MKYNAIVVGGGIAGLTATAYLAKSNKNVLLIEKNEKCGGLVNSFVKDGFTFDGGIRDLENVGIIIPMIRDLGIELNLIKSIVSIGIEDQVIKIESKDNIEDYKNLLIRLFPDKTCEINKAIKLIKEITEEMEVLYKFDNPMFLNLKSNLSESFKHIPWLFRFLKTLYKMNSLKMPVEGYLEKIVKDQSLRDMITQHFFKATPTFFALGYFYLYTDYFYPEGGIGVLSEKIEQKAIENGANIITERKVTKVIPSQNLVIDSLGNEFYYDKLIWAADLKTLYKIMDLSGLDKREKELIEHEKTKILEGHGSDSVFTIFLGVDLDPTFFKNIHTGHFFYTPERKGLTNLYKEDSIENLRNSAPFDKRKVFEWLEKFCELTTYEIFIPALRDPNLAPPHKTGLIIGFLFDYRLTKRIYEQGYYDEFKDFITNKVIDVLTRSIYKDLKDKILFSFSATPLTIEEYVGSNEGSIIGWSFEEPQPVESNMLFVMNSVKTPIKNVFKAGQWVYSPAGVPMSILTGRLAAKLAFGA